ncbi:MAG TPA: S53 family peptidase [Gaiellales bacterium]
MIRLAALAACCALWGAAATPALAAGPAHSRSRSRLVAVAGSVVPATTYADAAGAALAPTLPVEAVIALKPRNAALLHRLAESSSGRPGLSEALIRRLFAPTPARVRTVRNYLAAHGLVVTAHTDMTLTVAGDAGAAEQAFGVGLRVFRSPAGRTFRAPTGAIRLPTGIAGSVQSVGGLDTSVRLTPATSRQRVNRPAAVITPSCTGATSAQHTLGGYLPADLGQAYGSNSLITAGADGTGETIGMVEFSSYARSDVNHFRTCFPGITGAYDSDVTVGGPNSDTSGKGEVALDLEVAMAAAPDAQLRAYIAPNDPNFAPALFDQMRQDGVTIISDSWGACEPLISPGLLAAENTSLELAAVAGISTFVATGDFGSTDCFPFTGSTALFVDDPSSQPFATAVGGTALEAPPVYGGGQRETAWHGAGGGISMHWPKPAYQLGKTVQIRGRKCRSGLAQCRETPDVSLDARPRRSGYIIYCNRCGAGRGIVWAPVGGTSAAAPLMAALTADADESAGKQLGFANPFLYAQAGTAVFHDIVSGTNNLFGGNHYTAKPGYDLATGLGSIRAGAFAAALAAYSPAPVSVDSTALHIAGPVDGRQITYGRRVAFRGTLIDTTTSRPVANAAVMVVTNIETFRVRTNAAGAWRVTRSKAIARNVTWHAVYLGSDTHLPAVTATRKLDVTPRLGLTVQLPFAHGHYTARPGAAFTAMGRSRPLMSGAEVALQARRGRRPWTNLVFSRVAGGGRYEATGIVLGRGESEQLRWAYLGGAFRRWLPAQSRSRTVVAP